MARPKKSNQPSVRDRMIEAFWQLLEDNQLHEISVGMIVAKAGCNRGTFYYHFADKDADIFLSGKCSEILPETAKELERLKKTEAAKAENMEKGEAVEKAMRPGRKADCMES